MMQSLTDPRMQAEVEAMYQRLETYWMANVKRYFSKTEKNYPGLRGRYRQWVAWRDSSGQRLQNAIGVNYNSANNTVRIYSTEILVPLRKQIAYVDLIEYLRKGTQASPGSYSVWSDTRRSIPEHMQVYNLKDTRAIKRMYVRARNANIGQRKATTGTQWTNWWNDFIGVLDAELEQLADKLADIVQQDLQVQLNEEF